MRASTLFFILLTLFVGTAFAAKVDTVQVDIAPQRLATALNEFAEQSGLQIFYLAETVAGRWSQGFSGSGTEEEVLSALLADTSLEWRRDNDRSFSITRGESPTGPPADDADTVAIKIANPEKPFQAEIVVTANRRKQRLIDVPMSVSVYDYTFIEDRSFNRINQLVALTPSTNAAPTTVYGDVNRLIIRGIGHWDSGVASTGVYLDDVALTVDVGGKEANFRLFDLERVEILRGPQGTLYGAGAMGGAAKYITKKPVLSGIEGQARLEAASLAHGEHDVALDVAVNVPIVKDKLAVRFAGSRVDGGGYLDLPNLEDGPIEDSNSRQITALRGTLRWQPTEKLTLDLVAFRDQRKQQRRATSWHDGACCFQDDLLTQTPQDLDAHFQTLTLNLSYDLGWAELRSVTSDFEAFEHVSISTEPARFSPVPIYAELPFDWGAFAQEVRLLSTHGGNWTWTAGLYYQDRDHEESTATSIPDLGIDDLGTRSDVDGSRQLSAYGDATYQISDRWAATAGLRLYNEEVAKRNSSTSMGGPPTEREGQHDFREAVPRFALAYRPSPRINVYASAAKGIRAGFIIPPTLYTLDSLWAYEVGVKAVSRKVDLAAALYYNDWAGVSPTVNTAYRAGMELALGWEVINGLRVGLNGDISEAKDDDIPSHIFSKPEWSLALLVGYDRPLSTDTLLSVRVDGSYQAGTLQFGQVVPLKTLETWNALVGVARSSYEIAAFVRNITNQICGARDGLTYPFGVYHWNSPRAIGLQFVTRF